MKNCILLLGTLMLMMLSCSDEEIFSNEELKNDAEPTLTIIATQGEDASTRIAYNPDGETISLTWTEGDAIYVTDGTDYVELALTDGEGTNKGTFETTEDLPFEEGAQLKAYYKANEWMYDEDWRDFYPSWYYDLNQASNGDMKHLKELNYMESAEFEYEAGGVSNLRFTQMGALMKLSLTGLEGKTVKKLILMSADGSEALLNGIYDGYYYYYMNKTILTFGEDGTGIVLAADETLTAYLMLGAMEWDEPKQFKLFAETTDGVYLTYLQGDALVAGEFYSLDKTMTEYTFIANGSGTEADPYQITSVADLRNLSDWINIELSTQGVYFKLMNDIDLSSVCGEGIGNWKRIGTDGNWFDDDDNVIGFNGIFDGNGKTISGLYLNDKDAEDVGFFGCVAEGGVLKDLHVEGTITAYWYSGGVACSNHGTISGCTFSGSVTCEDIGAGGIVGFNRGTIEGCSNAGTIKAGDSAEDSAGGIVGYMNGGSITACYNTGSVSGDYAGGIVGEINYAYGTVSITGCYNTGALSGTTYTGGVVGSINESTVSIENCYWSSTDNAVGSGSATTTDCNGSTTDWSTAMTVMNTALSSTSWKYVENDDVVTKVTIPLLLKNN